MTTQHTITDLRAALFQTLAALQDKNNPMDIERAKAINETAQVIVNTAKVEVDFARATGRDNTGFIPFSAAAPAALPTRPAGAFPLHSQPDAGTDTATGTKTTQALGQGANLITHKMR